MNTNSSKGETFEALCRAKGISWAEIARKSGVSPQVVNNWRTRGVSSAKAGAVASVLSCRVSDISEAIDLESEIIGDVRVSPRNANRSNVEPGPPLRKPVPVISWVSAGSWCDADDPYPPGMAESWEECPYDHSERSVCLRVVGDSMSPEYREGELILVDPAIEAGHGDDVIARTPDGKATFKRLQVTPDGTFLIALNPSYPERIIKAPADTHICGVVTASWMQRRKRG